MRRGFLKKNIRLFLRIVLVIKVQPIVVQQLFCSKSARRLKLEKRIEKRRTDLQNQILFRKQAFSAGSFRQAKMQVADCTARIKFLEERIKLLEAVLERIQ